MNGYAEYCIARIDHGKRIVWIIDANVGGTTVTNAAEGVCAALNRDYPGYRIIYQDTDGAWDELQHDAGRFTGFAPAREMAL